MNNIITLIIISLTVSSCVKNDIHHINYTGYEINKKFKKIQEFNMDFEIENNGPIYEDKISIYKISQKLCAIVSKIDSDSGVYGTERVIYFNNLKYQSGYINTFSYVFLKNNENNKTNKIKYIERIDNLDTQKNLNHDFNQYKKSLNKNTAKSCS